MFEDFGELRKVRAKALFLALADKWVIINADQSAEQVELEIRRHLFAN
jgi:thymidylate kinase